MARGFSPYALAPTDPVKARVLALAEYELTRGLSPTERQEKNELNAVLAGEREMYGPNWEANNNLNYLARLNAVKTHYPPGSRMSSNFELSGKGFDGARLGPVGLFPKVGGIGAWDRSKPADEPGPIKQGQDQGYDPVPSSERLRELGGSASPAKAAPSSFSPYSGYIPGGYGASRAEQIADLPGVEPVSGSDPSDVGAALGKYSYLSPVDGTFAEGPSGYYHAKRGSGGRLHSGGDWGAEVGSIARVTIGGTVLTKHYDGGKFGYGWVADVLGDDGLVHRYAPHQAISAAVGDRLEAGDEIGIIGAAPKGSYSHLHYEIQVPGTPADLAARKGIFGKSSYYGRGVEPTYDLGKFFNLERGVEVAGGQPLPGQGPPAPPAPPEALAYDPAELGNEVSAPGAIEVSRPQPASLGPASRAAVGSSGPVSADDADKLADMAYREARGEGIDGMRAVMHVAKNRADAATHWQDYPALTGVKKWAGQSVGDLASSSEFAGGRVDRNSSEWKQARAAAEGVLSGADEDITKGSLFFSNDPLSDPGALATIKAAAPDTLASIGKQTFRGVAGISPQQGGAPEVQQVETAADEPAVEAVPEAPAAAVPGGKTALYLPGLVKVTGEARGAELDRQMVSALEGMGYTVKVGPPSVLKKEDGGKSALAQQTFLDENGLDENGNLRDDVTVAGFSAGAIRGDDWGNEHGLPQGNRVLVGAPGRPGNRDVEGVEHLDQPAAFARAMRPGIPGVGQPLPNVKLETLQHAPAGHPATWIPATPDTTEYPADVDPSAAEPTEADLAAEQEAYAASQRQEEADLEAVRADQEAASAPPLSPEEPGLRTPAPPSTWGSMAAANQAVDALVNGDIPTAKQLLMHADTATMEHVNDLLKLNPDKLETTVENITRLTGAEVPYELGAHLEEARVNPQHDWSTIPRDVNRGDEEGFAPAREPRPGDYAEGGPTRPPVMAPVPVARPEPPAALPAAPEVMLPRMRPDVPALAAGVPLPRVRPGEPAAVAAAPKTYQGSPPPPTSDEIVRAFKIGGRNEIGVVTDRLATYLEIAGRMEGEEGARRAGMQIMGPVAAQAVADQALRDRIRDTPSGWIAPDNWALSREPVADGFKKISQVPTTSEIGAAAEEKGKALIVAATPAAKEIGGAVTGFLAGLKKGAAANAEPTKSPTVVADTYIPSIITGGDRPTTSKVTTVSAKPSSPPKAGPGLFTSAPVTSLFGRTDRPAEAPKVSTPTLAHSLAAEPKAGASPYSSGKTKDDTDAATYAGAAAGVISPVKAVPVSSADVGVGLKSLVPGEGGPEKVGYGGRLQKGDPGYVEFKPPKPEPEVLQKNPIRAAERAGGGGRPAGFTTAPSLMDRVSAALSALDAAQMPHTPSSALGNLASQGYTMPNFSSGSGGSSMAYKPGTGSYIGVSGNKVNTGTYVDSQGNPHNYDMG